MRDTDGRTAADLAQSRHRACASALRKIEDDTRKLSPKRRPTPSSGVSHGGISVGLGLADADGAAADSERAIPVPVVPAPGSPDDRRERCIASVLLAAAGDALGHRCQANSRAVDVERQVKEAARTNGLDASLPDSRVTSATILALATADAVVTTLGPSRQAALLTVVTPEGEWAVSPLTAQPLTEFVDALSAAYARAKVHIEDRAPPGRVMRSLALLSGGTHWRSLPYNARADILPNGAEVRACCLGLALCGARRRALLIAAAVESARLTHNHVSAIVAAVTAAVFSAFALEGVPLGDWGVRLIRDILPATRHYVAASLLRGSGETHAIEAHFAVIERVWVQYLDRRGLWSSGLAPSDGSTAPGAFDGGAGALAIKSAVAWVRDADRRADATRQTDNIVSSGRGGAGAPVGGVSVHQRRGSLKGAPAGATVAIFPAAYGVSARDYEYRTCFSCASAATLSPASASNGFAGWDSLSAPLIAYDALLASCGEWSQVVSGALMHGGDTCATAALAFAWHGALYGDRGAPASVARRVEFREVLVATGKHLARLAQLRPTGGGAAGFSQTGAGGETDNGAREPDVGAGDAHGPGGAVRAPASSIESAWPAPHTTLAPADFDDDCAILTMSSLHGHLDMFDRALAAARAMVGPRTHLVVVTLGNYVDNGPQVPALLNRLIGLRTRPPPRMTLLPIAGPHDVACALAADSASFGAGSTVWFKRWVANYILKDPKGSGHSRCLSTPMQYVLPDTAAATADGAAASGPTYEVDVIESPPRPRRTGSAHSGVEGGEPNPQHAGEVTSTEFRAAFPQDHLRFLRSLPWYIELGAYVFVHSGLSTGSLPAQLAALAARDLSSAPAGRLPAALRDRSLSVVADSAWNRIVISGNGDFDTSRDYLNVANRRLALQTGTGSGGALHCALLHPRALGFTGADAPQLFEIRPIRK